MSTATSLTGSSYNTTRGGKKLVLSSGNLLSTHTFRFVYTLRLGERDLTILMIFLKRSYRISGKVNSGKALALYLDRSVNIIE